MTNDIKKILVLGVGNILYTDEGVGVRLVEKLLDEFDFDDNVEVMDGGTLGTRLIDPIMSCDYLIVVDAVLGGDEPGSVYRLRGNDLRKSLAFKNSMHQTDLVDTLMQCDFLGHRPDATVIGIEPFDYKTMAIEVSPEIRERFDAIADFVLHEVKSAGGGYSAKHS